MAAQLCHSLVQLKQWATNKTFVNYRNFGIFMIVAKMLTDEIGWDVTLQNSQEKLSNLAQEALNEYKTGKTQQTDW